MSTVYPNLIHECVLELLKFSFRVNECKPLLTGTSSFDTSCYKCAAGSYSENKVGNNTECNLCSAGTSSAILGADTSGVCGPCSENTVSNEVWHCRLTQLIPH